MVIEVVKTTVAGSAEHGAESRFGRGAGTNPHAGEPQARSPESATVVALPTTYAKLDAHAVRFLDLKFHNLDVAQAASIVSDRARLGGSFAWVATPNADHRVRMAREPEVMAAYDSAWLTLLDSRVIELMARAERLSLRATPGADLVEYLFRNQIDPATTRVNVVGGSPAMIEALRTRFGLVHLRWHNPPMGLRHKPDEIAKAASFVAANPAEFTFLCVGSPQQELVANAILERGDCIGVGLCCGASLEFLTGMVHRAPRWMRNMALEWLYRFACNPRKFARRYFWDDPAIVGIWMNDRAARGAVLYPAAPQPDMDGEKAVGTSNAV